MEFLGFSLSDMQVILSLGFTYGIGLGFIFTTLRFLLFSAVERSGV